MCLSDTYTQDDVVQGVAQKDVIDPENVAGPVAKNAEKDPKIVRGAIRFTFKEMKTHLINHNVFNENFIIKYVLFGDYFLLLYYVTTTDVFYDSLFFL